MNDYLECTMHWTDARLKVPTIGVDVIVALKDETGDSPWYYTTCGWYTGDEKRRWIVDNEFSVQVTHWMPFPRYPQKVIK